MTDHKEKAKFVSGNLFSDVKTCKLAQLLTKHKTRVRCASSSLFTNVWIMNSPWSSTKDTMHVYIYTMSLLIIHSILNEIYKLRTVAKVYFLVHTEKSGIRPQTQLIHILGDNFRLLRRTELSCILNSGAVTPESLPLVSLVTLHSGATATPKIFRSCNQLMHQDQLHQFHRN